MHWVLLRLSKNKIVKGNPSPLDPEAPKSCTWVCVWGDKTLRIQILLHCLKRFFLLLGHSYSTTVWPHNHNWAALHTFEIATIPAGKTQASFWVWSVSHRLGWVWWDTMGIFSFQPCEIPLHLLGTRWTWNHKKCWKSLHSAISDLCVLKSWKRALKRTWLRVLKPVVGCGHLILNKAFWLSPRISFCLQYDNRF